MSGFEAVIGLEVHAQLNTKSKIFCGCATAAAEEPNTNVCPTCLGMPGTLPVLNESVVDFAIRTGLALNCEINRNNIIDRKNYFYPDSPKGYQITQFDMPIVGEGVIDVKVGDEIKQVRLERAHLEEDAGKSTHHGDYTLINLNRAGIPLLEIVSKPDMRSAQEAAAYAKTVRSILRYLKVCDGNLEEG